MITASSTAPMGRVSPRSYEECSATFGSSCCKGNGPKIARHAGLAGADGGGKAGVLYSMVHVGQLRLGDHPACIACRAHATGALDMPLFSLRPALDVSSCVLVASLLAGFAS